MTVQAANEKAGSIFVAGLFKKKERIKIKRKQCQNVKISKTSPAVINQKLNHSDQTFSQLNQDNSHQKLIKAKLPLLELYHQKLLKTLFLLNIKLILFHQKLSLLDFNPSSNQVLLLKLSKCFEKIR